jgi:hypothetical protein
LSIHASIEPDRIRSKFTKPLKTAGIGFTMTVDCKGGGELIGRSEQGLASAAEHFGRHLAMPCSDHERKRQQQAEAALNTAASVTR